MRIYELNGYYYKWADIVDIVEKYQRRQKAKGMLLKAISAISAAISVFCMLLVDSETGWQMALIGVLVFMLAAIIAGVASKRA